MPWYIWIIIILVAIFYFTHLSNKKRRERLMLKYNDPHLVDRLMAKSFWQGQTKEQLIDSLGNPADISSQILKTKTKEVYKYQKTGSNRYALKIIIENGEVVGWDKK